MKRGSQNYELVLWDNLTNMYELKNAIINPDDFLFKNV